MAEGGPVEQELRSELLYLRKRHGLADRGRLRERPLRRLRDCAAGIRHRRPEGDVDPLRDVYDVIVETIKEQRGRSLTNLAGDFALSRTVHGEISMTGAAASPSCCPSTSRRSPGGGTACSGR